MHHTTVTGSWSELPDCIKPDEPVTVTLTGAVVTELTPRMSDYDAGTNYMCILLDGGTLDTIDINVRPDYNPGTMTTSVELLLGQGAPGDTREVVVEFSAGFGSNEYRYLYSWAG